MNRPIVYQNEVFRSYDVLHGWRDALEGLAQLSSDAMFGSATPYAVVTGLQPTQTTTPSLTVNVAAGAIYQIAAIDPNGYGALTGTGPTMLLQGQYAGGTLTFSTAGLSGGQGQWALVQGQFQFDDVIPSDDPNAGVLPNGNPANPQQPLNGPGGSGLAQNTEREGTLVLQVIYGTPATQGSEAPPTPTSGWVGLYLVNLVYGQTQLTIGNAMPAGPNLTAADGATTGNYAQAPFLSGLLNSHHGGVPGQAPKINLANEVTGVLPAANGGTGDIVQTAFNGPTAGSAVATMPAQASAYKKVNLPEGRIR